MEKGISISQYIDIYTIDNHHIIMINVINFKDDKFVLNKILTIFVRKINKCCRKPANTESEQ